MAEVPVRSEITASVWKILVGPGDLVSGDQEMMILESMKMEIPLMAPVGGTVMSLAVAEGDTVMEGQVAAVIDAL